MKQADSYLSTQNFCVLQQIHTELNLHRFASVTITRKKKYLGLMKTIHTPLVWKLTLIQMVECTPRTVFVRSNIRFRRKYWAYLWSRLREFSSKLKLFSQNFSSYMRIIFLSPFPFPSSKGLNSNPWRHFQILEWLKSTTSVQGYWEALISTLDFVSLEE